jgi:septal ring factor EnvC (AmiA/AmiB activator)
MRWSPPLLAAFAVVTLAGAADGAQPSAAKLKRQQAAETARAKALKKQAQEAAQDEAALKTGLADVAAQVSSTKEAAFAAESEAAAAQTRSLSEAADLARERRALELTITALLQRDADFRTLPLMPADARAGALVGAAAPALARAVTAREARLDESRKLAVAKSQESADLDAAAQSLAQQREETASKLNETAKRRAALLAESQRAAKKAAELGRKAKSLQDLAARVSPAPKARANGKTLTARPTGPHRAPVDGTIVVAFGQATPAGPAKGVTLRTKPGAKIVAPASATVGYAGPFRSYGQVLILDQGNGYSLVLTGLQSVLAPPGKKVSVGEIVGEMASPSASPAPELYFEVREAGRAVDPERWLKAK